MSSNYAVQLEVFAERHFVKRFAKKYKNAWDVTWKAIEDEFCRFDSLLQTSIAETIVQNEKIRICKTEFRVAGTPDSRKGSGNRCIVAVHGDIELVRVLLVYNKSDLKSSNETAAWKTLVRDNYSEYRGILK